VAYLAEEVGEWKTLVSGESPGKSGYRGERAEHSDDAEEDNQGHESSGSTFRSCRRIQDFNDGVHIDTTQGVLEIPDTVQDRNDECPSHGTVDDNAGNHTLGHSSRSILYLSACTLLAKSREKISAHTHVKHSIESSQRKSAREQTDTPLDSRTGPST
jgi:hypothetical protein